MNLDMLLSYIRDILKKISENRDENAIKNLIKTILDLKDREKELKIISQLIHDEKTYVLSDTEILRGREYDLINIASIYHILYELCRIFIYKDKNYEVDIDYEKAILEKNLTDITYIIDRVLRMCIVGEDVNKEFEKLNNIISKIDSKDLRNFMIISLIRNLENIVKLIKEVESR